MSVSRITGRALGFYPYEDDWLYFFFWLKAGIHTCPVRSLRYGWWAYVLGERTTPRLKETSKIFCIDGNLASGKGALAQKLADHMGRWSYRMGAAGSQPSRDTSAQTLVIYIYIKKKRTWAQLKAVMSRRRLICISITLLLMKKGYVKKFMRFIY